MLAQSLRMPTLAARSRSTGAATARALDRRPADAQLGHELTGVMLLLLGRMDGSGGGRRRPVTLRSPVLHRDRQQQQQQQQDSGDKPKARLVEIPPCQ
ncbi:hypothetical protein [Nonomuraea rubra]|uniref:Uncharacterized protein n=1 Tax=Nonomuraea rubra TaxID=46180 RepID=A0A7X0NPG2_9ACTN|nr:hypothetical protein [Nonomuraea rubra]MBB6547011.1 hypothetical protein [Nonomuraea rubra]